MGSFLTRALLHYQRNKQASPCVSSSIPVPASAPAAFEFISEFKHVSCASILFYVFSPWGVTLLQDLFRDKSTFLHLPMALQAALVLKRDTHISVLVPVPVHQGTPCEHFAVGKPSLEHPLCPSPCPTEMVRSYQRHQKRPLSAGLFPSIPPQWSAGHLFISPQTTLAPLDPGFPFNSSKTWTCSCCFQNLQPCTQCTPGCSQPGHTWCTNSSLAEPALWSHTVWFSSTRVTTNPALTSLHIFVKLTLSH